MPHCAPEAVGSIPTRAILVRHRGLGNGENYRPVLLGRKRVVSIRLWRGGGVPDQVALARPVPYMVLKSPSELWFGAVQFYNCPTWTVVMALARSEDKQRIPMQWITATPGSFRCPHPSAHTVLLPAPTQKCIKSSTKHPQ